jgi:hypothetical protein
MNAERAAIVSGLLFFIAAVPSAWADDPAARQILEKSVARYQASSMEYAGEVITTAPSGRERRKTWRSYREGYGPSANRLIRFLSPPDVRGVGFLLLGRPGDAPDQWMYLPSMKRERRVAPRDRDAPFVGTDFTFEDLEEIDPSRLDAEQEADRTVDGHACYVIAVRPRYQASYDRQLLTLRKDTLELLRVEIFSAGASTPVRRLVLSDYQVVQGRPTAMKLEMSDLRKGSRTTILVSEVIFDRPQPADRFTIQNLIREVAD